MNKHKTVTKYNVTNYFIKSRRHQQIDEDAVRKINFQEIPNLLKVSLLKRKKSFRLVYNVTGLVSLEDYLKKSVNKKELALILCGILNLFGSLKKKHMEAAKVNFNMDSIFINSYNCALYFIYVPICDLKDEVVERELLYAIIDKCQCPSGEDASCKASVYKYLQDHANVSGVELKQLLKRMLEPEKTYGQERTSGFREEKDCPFCKKKIGGDSIFCPYCGGKLEEEKQKEESDFSVKPDFGKKGTTLLGVGQSQSPYIVCSRKGEQISILGSPFCMGRDRSRCHYCVEDNTAVGRNHAEIIIDGGRYFIMDNGSTNYTYIDGHRIEPNRRVEIFNGTRFRLANEDFIFYVGQGG